MLLSDVLIYAVTLCILHGLCRQYYLVSIPQHQRSNAAEARVVRHCFAGTLSCSLCMLLLMLFEVLGITTHKARALLWGVLLRSTSASLLLVVPFLLPYFALRRRGVRRSGAAAAAAVSAWAFLAAFWFGLRSLPINEVPPVDAASGAHRSLADELRDLPQGGADLMTEVVSRLAVIGVACMGVLSGFGAVNFPISCLLPLFRPVTRQVLKEQKQRLQAARALLRSRKEHAEPEAGNSRHESGRRFGSIRSRRKRMLADQRELRLLEKLCVDLEDELDETRAAYDVVRQSRTLVGKCTTFLGWSLSLYCVARMVLAVQSVSYQVITHTGFMHPEPIGNRAEEATVVQDSIAALVVDFADQTMDLGHARHGWVRAVSVVLVGVLMACQARAFFVAVQKMSRKGAQNVSATTSALVITEVSGAFFIAVVMMLRTELPERLREAVTAALGGGNGRIHFDFYNTWFDSIFLVSALLSAALLYSLHESRVTVWDVPAAAATVAVYGNPDDGDLEAQHVDFDASGLTSPLRRPRFSSAASATSIIDTLRDSDEDSYARPP